MTGRLSLRVSLGILGLLFVVTGAVGLLAEQAFERLLGTLVGTSTPAGATVLGVYFGGLTLGGLGYGRFVAGRVRQPLLAYAALEGGIALWSVGLAAGFHLLIPMFVPLLRLGVGHLPLLQGLRVLVAACWILPPTILMGATFPAVVAVLESWRTPSRGRVMARFYALNLAGAILAAALGPYLLFPAFGLDGTLVFGAGLDALVAAVAVVVSLRRWPRTRGAALRDVEPAPRLPRILVVVAFASGFLFFALEVLFTHLIAAVLGNSIFSFSAMLAIVLLGLCLGGLLTGGHVERRFLPDGAPGAFFILGAAALAVTHRFWPSVPHSLAVWGAGLTRFDQGELLRWIHATLLLLPAATLLGLCYPSLFRVRAFPLGQAAVVAGRLGAFNALGCLLGALSTGFLLLPALGSEASLTLITLLYVVLGIVVSVAFLQGRARLVLCAIGLGVLGSASRQAPWDQLALTSGEHVYFRSSHVPAGSKLRLFHEDSYGGITTVAMRPDGTRVLLTNGKFQGDDAGETEAQTGFVLIPALHLDHLEKALVIGLGTGQSMSIVRELGFPRIDVAEISPGMVAAARTEFGHLNRGVLEDPRVRIHLEDGRNLVLLDETRYDLITMEISSVWFMGATNLYSRDFYELARQRLEPGGVLQQWIQVHHIGYQELGSVIATVRSVFPNVSFWLRGGQGILVATSEPQVVRSAGLASVLKAGQATGWTAARAPDELRRLLGSRVLGPGELTALVVKRGFRVNDDRNRFLEYRTPRYNLSQAPLQKINVWNLAYAGGREPIQTGPEVPEAFRSLAASVDRAYSRSILGVPETLPSEPVPAR